MAEYIRMGVWAVPLAEFLSEYKPKLNDQGSGNIFGRWRYYERYDRSKVLVIGGKAIALELYVVRRGLWGYVLLVVNKVMHVLRYPFVLWSLRCAVIQYRKDHIKENTEKMHPSVSIWSVRGFAHDTSYSIISRTKNESHYG